MLILFIFYYVFRDKRPSLSYDPLSRMALWYIKLLVMLFMTFFTGVLAWSYLIHIKGVYLLVALNPIKWLLEEEMIALANVLPSLLVAFIGIVMYQLWPPHYRFVKARRQENLLRLANLRSSLLASRSIDANCREESSRARPSPAAIAVLAIQAARRRQTESKIDPPTTTD